MALPTNRPLPQSVRFVKLTAYARKAFTEEIAEVNRPNAYDEFMTWYQNNPRVCEGMWYIEFSHFLLVGTDKIGENIHRIGYSIFVGSWEILKNGTITGKQYGVS